MNQDLKFFLEENGYRCNHSAHLYASFTKENEEIMFAHETNSIKYFVKGILRFECKYHILPLNNIIMLLAGCGAVDLNKFASLAKSVL